MSEEKMMMVSFTSSFLVVLLLGIASGLDETQEWRLWKAKYSKSYGSVDEESKRLSIWLKNKAYVTEHNSMETSFELEMNQFADMTSDEFVSIYNGYLGEERNTNATDLYHKTSGAALPSSVDWRKEGLVTEVKDQGKCGSCWAFSTTGSLEGAHAKKTSKLVSLSEQNLIDCDKKDKGCKGGLMTTAFKYIEENGGIDTEASYPYKGKSEIKERCKFKKADIGATVSRHISIKMLDCVALKEAVGTIGPISAAMDASHSSFQLYKRGIYEPKKCSESQLDHGILVVGYGSLEGEEYWLVKNSWGKKWGMEGYFMIAAKNNLCGICTSACYPVV